MTTHSPEPSPAPDLRPLPGKQTGSEVTQLVGLMQRLLAPDGCPWDREQTLATLVPYLIEETYEVVDALAEGGVEEHKEELGDLLLQIVFQAELRHREGAFGIDDVARGIVAKLIRRHPHVFGDVHAKDAREALASWAKLKRDEKSKYGEKKRKSALDGVPRSAPALLAAARTGEKAGAAGFDFADVAGPRAKIDEELAELDEACRAGDRATMERELGDTLFSVVNLARKLDLDAESALRAAVGRFARRFQHMEATLEGSGRVLGDVPPDEQDRLWRAAKDATLDRSGAASTTPP